MTIIKKAKEIFTTRTFKESLITSSGTIINGILGMLFYVLMARYLGPAKFGIFSVATVTVALLSGIVNFGIDTGIVRFVGKYYSDNRQKALKFLKLALEIKLLSALLLILIGWFIIPFVARNILFKEELIFPLRLSLFGVGTSLLFSFVTSCLQAIQRFWLWAGLNIFSNLLRLTSIIVLFTLGVLNIGTGLGSYIIFPFVGFFLGFLFLPNFYKVRDEKQVFAEFFHYNKWVAVLNFISPISSRLDIYISTRLLSLTEVGIYSVAVSLSGIVLEIVFSLAIVVAPKLASFSDINQVKRYLKKLQLFVCGLALLGLVVGIPLASYVIPKFYGLEYAPSILPFSVLLFAQAIFLISVPAHTSVFYYFSYPKLFATVSLVHLLITSIGGFVLITKFGYLGASFTVLIGNLSNFIIPGIWVLNRLKKDK